MVTGRRSNHPVDTPVPVDTDVYDLVSVGLD